MGELATGDEVHSWAFEITAEELIMGPERVTISAAPAVDQDGVIYLQDVSGAILAGRNVAGRGQPETLEDFTLDRAGSYQILVRSANGMPGSYAIVLLFRDSYAFVFKESLVYDTTVATDLPAETDHFWNFGGEAGDVVTIRVVPDPAANMLVELWDLKSDIVLAQVFDPFGEPGEAREIVDFTLPADGFYSIRVGEFVYRPAQYELTLSAGQ